MLFAVFLLLVLHQAFCVTVTEDVYGQFSGQDVLRYTFTNNNNVTVEIITYGGRIAVVKVPDNTGKIDDVVLGFDNLAGMVILMTS